MISALRVNRSVANVDTPDGPRVVRGAGDGHVFALDANTGAPEWNVSIGDVKFRYDTGQPVGGGIASDGVGGKQRVAVASGMTSPTWKSTGTKARVIVFGLP